MLWSVHNIITKYQTAVAKDHFYKQIKVYLVINQITYTLAMPVAIQLHMITHKYKVPLPHYYQTKNVEKEKKILKLQREIAK